MTEPNTLKYEHIEDVHTLWKLLKSQQVSYNDFSVNQIYKIKQTYGQLFDETYNQLPKIYGEDSELISQSQIQTFKKCQRLWYLQKWLRLKPEVRDDTWLRFGRAIHEILEHFYETIDIEAANMDAIVHFEYVLNKILLVQYWDFSLREGLMEDAQQILKDFAYVFGTRFSELTAQGKQDLFFPASTEERIIATSYPLHSVVDRINKGYKSFGDYKTNKAFPEILLQNPSSLTGKDLYTYNSTAEEYAIQATINAICIYDKYKIMPESCTFIFVRHLRKPHGGMINITVTQDLINQVVAYVNEIFTSISNKSFNKTADINRCNDFGGCEYTMSCDAMDVCIGEI